MAARGFQKKITWSELLERAYALVFKQHFPQLLQRRVIVKLPIRSGSISMIPIRLARSGCVDTKMHDQSQGWNENSVP
jgi:hypothetical protein